MVRVTLSDNYLILSDNGPWWPVSDLRPLIYASLGRLQNGLDHLFQTILDACAELPVRLVLALGREGGPRPQRVPANATVLGCAPQLELLREASLVVTHGDLNSTLEALAHGLPLVVLPIARDQPAVAPRVQHFGSGDFQPIRGLTAARLRRLIEKIAHTPKYRETARQYAMEIRRANGLASAADPFEEALLNRRRLTRPKQKQSVNISDT